MDIIYSCFDADSLKFCEATLRSFSTQGARRKTFFQARQLTLIENSCAASSAEKKQIQIVERKMVARFHTIAWICLNTILFLVVFLPRKWTTWNDNERITSQSDFIPKIISLRLVSEEFCIQLSMCVPRLEKEVN